MIVEYLQGSSCLDPFWKMAMCLREAREQANESYTPANVAKLETWQLHELVRDLGRIASQLSGEVAEDWWRYRSYVIAELDGRSS